MIRRLTPAPEVWDSAALAAEVGALSVNTVDGDGVRLAAYWDDADPAALDDAGWAAAVAAHVPPPAPPADPFAAFAEMLDERLADPAVNSIAEVKAEIREALAAALGS